MSNATPAMERFDLVYKNALSRLQKEVLTTQEAMDYLSVSRKTLDRLKENNEIKCIKVRGCNRFNLVDLVEYSLNSRVMA